MGTPEWLRLADRGEVRAAPAVLVTGDGEGAGGYFRENVDAARGVGRVKDINVAGRVGLDDERISGFSMCRLQMV